LEDATPGEIQALIERLKDGPMGDRLRADWLKLLGMRQQWELFDAEYPQLVTDDTELLCFRCKAGCARAAPRC
jgi:soluble lytic murein transglycosylase